jgi:hypothetical protein
MSTPIRSLVEDRLDAYLSPLLTGVAVHKGVTDETRVLPIVIIHATNANRPSSLGTVNFGNYRVGVTVYVYSSADDGTLNDHRVRVETVEAAMADVAALKTAWGSASQYGTLYDAWIETDNEGMQGRKYGNSITYTLFVCMPTEPPPPSP